MTAPLRLLAVFAHPDDESLATGALLSKYAAAGVETYLVTATRGERGWWGDPETYPGPAALGKIREAELLAAAQTLGLREVHFLGYQDGELDQADPQEAIRRIVQHIRRIRPQVVITFDPYGVYGHPDHIAICQLTTAAIVAAAGSNYPMPDSPHQVNKLYYLAESAKKFAAYQRVFGDLVIEVNGVERRTQGWESWAITTQVDTEAHWQHAWQAVSHHRSQLPGYGAIQKLPDAQRRALWSLQSLYRVFSLVNGGSDRERDLFAGLYPSHVSQENAVGTVKEKRSQHNGN